jgi:hypothetical protein
MWQCNMKLQNSLHVWILICQALLFSRSKGRIFLESRHNQGAVPECMLHNFRAIGGLGPFEDPNFAFLTVRTNFVCKFCSPRHLRNIRSILGKNYYMSLCGLHEYVWHVFCTRHYLSVKIQSSLAQTNSESQIYLEDALKKN